MFYIVFIIILVALETLSPQALADVKLPAIFGDHMVLQQEQTIPVWGTADPNEKVTVTLGTETADTTADASGHWMVKLPALPNGTPATTLTVAGKNTLTFTDVLVGDVWLCSGQSNMEYPVRNPISMVHNPATELPKGNDPQVRLFLIQAYPSPAEKESLQPETDVLGKWQVTPRNRCVISAPSAIISAANCAPASTGLLA